MFNLHSIQRRLTPVLREIIWLVPLFIVGIFRLTDYPLLVGGAVVAAFLPWLAGQFVFERPFPPTPLDVPMVLLLAASVAGLVVSYDFLLSVPTFLTLLASIGVYYLVANGTLSPRQAVQGTVGVAALVSIYFLLQQVLPEQILLFNLQANAVAGFVGVTLLPALWLIWQSRSLVRPVWITAAGIITVALLVSGSRGAWLGLFLVGILTGILLTTGRIRQAAVTVLGMVSGTLLGAAGLLLLMPGHPVSRWAFSTLDGLDTRLALYKNSVYLWADYLFTGVGLGDAFAQAYSRYRLLIMPDYLYYPHNLWLSVGLGMGLAGVVALLWLIVNLYRFVGRVEVAGHGSVPARYLFRAVWLSSLLPLIHGFTDSPHFSNHLWAMPMLFVLWGLVVSTGQQLNISPRRWEGISLGRWGLLAVAVVVAAGLGFGWRSMAVFWHLNQGALYQTKAELSSYDAARLVQAKTHFDRVLVLDKENPAAHYRLGIMAMDQKDFNGAIAHFRQASQQQPDNEAIRKALALAYRAAGQPEKGTLLWNQLDSTSGITTGPHLWRY